jgi:hypothetical protein
MHTLISSNAVSTLSRTSEIVSKDFNLLFKTFCSDIFDFKYNLAISFRSKATYSLAFRERLAKVDQITERARGGNCRLRNGLL